LALFLGVVVDVVIVVFVAVVVSLLCWLHSFVVVVCGRFVGALAPSLAFVIVVVAVFVAMAVYAVNIAGDFCWGRSGISC